MANSKASTSDIALKLSKRASGVTAHDLKKSTGSKNVGPMAATLARLEKNGLIKRSGEERQGSAVFLFVKDPPPKAAKKTRAPRKADDEDPGLTAPKRASSTLSTALKMARRPRGVTAGELKKRLNSKTLGPMKRSLLTGVRKEVLEQTEDTRRGHPVFKATGKSLPRKPRKPAAKKGRPKKPGRKPGRPKKTAAPTTAVKKPARSKTPSFAGVATLDNADFVVALGKALEVFGQELARIGERKR